MLERIATAWYLVKAKVVSQLTDRRHMAIATAAIRLDNVLQYTAEKPAEEPAKHKTQAMQSWLTYFEITMPQHTIARFQISCCERISIASCQGNSDLSFDCVK